jgi:hypothetical protein
MPFAPGAGNKSDRLPHRRCKTLPFRSRTCANRGGRQRKARPCIQQGKTGGAFAAMICAETAITRPYSWAWLRLPSSAGCDWRCPRG